MRVHIVTFAIAFLFCHALSASFLADSFKKWTLDQAVELLNRSSWGKQETFTQVIGGIGSGIQGEKEIYNTFFVRFLSAPPIREAFARVQQIQMGYDHMSELEQQEVDQRARRVLDLDVSDWIVVAVTFRSNNARQESRVEQFLQRQTAETIRTRAFLVTDKFPKLQVQAYFPPVEQSVGAKFVFPRVVDGKPVLDSNDEKVVFELDVPGADPLLRATFPVQEMIIDGELVI